MRKKTPVGNSTSSPMTTACLTVDAMEFTQLVTAVLRLAVPFEIRSQSDWRRLRAMIRLQSLAHGLPTVPSSDGPRKRGAGANGLEIPAVKLVVPAAKAGAGSATTRKRTGR